MRREPATRAHEVHDRAGAIHRLERTDSERDIAANAVERTQQVEQRDRRVEIAAEGSQVDSREDDLLEPGRGHALDLGDQRWDRRAARRAARRRDDAVRAGFLAAGLGPNGECGAAGDAGLDRSAARATASW